MSRPRAAVYNRFWASMGGGERHSGRLAQSLTELGWNVDLIGHQNITCDEIADHLGLDLSRARMRLVPDRGEEVLADVSSEYDLFVNASYMSRLRPRATRNIYLCYFPTPFDHDFEAWRKWVVRRVGPYVRSVNRGWDFGTGWFPPEGGRRRRWTWTSGEGQLLFPANVDRTIRADFGRPGLRAMELSVMDDDGTEVTRFVVDPAFRRRTIELPRRGWASDVRLVSNTDTPGTTDHRHLGVALSRLHVGQPRNPVSHIGARYPWLLRDPDNLDFLESYDLVLANSDYTRQWIRRLWRVDAEVLFPPIRLDTLRPQAQRERIILTVGRFFAPGQGHSKRQLELVQFFGDMVGQGQLPGWKLHVVGGCEPSREEYLDRVRAAAAGLPVEIHANASRPFVEKLFDSASIFWSATGYGDDEERQPWAMEHFGMTTVEAMGGGCVPIVIDRAGQREIVRPGVDGFRWNTPEELQTLTSRVARDETLRATLSAASRERAREFSDDAFHERWRSLAKQLDLPETT